LLISTRQGVSQIMESAGVPSDSRARQKHPNNLTESLHRRERGKSALRHEHRWSTRRCATVLEMKEGPSGGIAGQVLTFRTEAWSSFAPPTRRMPLGRYQGIPRADPESRANPRF
jgi:hypothetical protein